MDSTETSACPVCLYDDGSGGPMYSPQFATHEICPCCGTHFGYDDFARPHRALRADWIAAGMRWWSRSPPPAGWDPVRQLEPATDE